MRKLLSLALVLAVLSLVLSPVSPSRASAHVRTVLPLSAPDLPEGIVLDHKGNFYLSMVLTGEIWKVTPDGTRTVLAKLDPGTGFTVAMAIDHQGNLYVANASHVAGTHGVWLVRPDGSKELYAAIPDLAGLPNQIAFDNRGNAYVADSGLGVIWRITRDRQVSVWLDHPWTQPKLPGDNPCNHNAIALPVGVNGIAFDQKGNLFAANEDRGLIFSVSIDPRTGAAGTPQLFLQSCQDLVGLDQIAFDNKGNLYAALNTQNKVIRISPSKQIEVLATAADGLAFPANLAFGTGPRAFGTGPGNRTELYITNVAFLGGAPSIQVMDVGVPGRPLP